MNSKLKFAKFDIEVEIESENLKIEN